MTSIEVVVDVQLSSFGKLFLLLIINRTNLWFCVCERVCESCPKLMTCLDVISDILLNDYFETRYDIKWVVHIVKKKSKIKSGQHWWCCNIYDYTMNWYLITNAITSNRFDVSPSFLL
jgi:hypothetical protein